MSDTTPTPDTSEPNIPEPNIPKPNIPKPNIPTPNIPKPNIPAPNLDRPSSSPPVSAVETGAMETPVAVPVTTIEEEEEEFSPVEYTETLLPQRIIAGIIDGLVAGVLSWFVALFLPNFLGTGVALAYLLFKDSLPFLGGQSVGKKVMKLQAVTTEGVALSTDIKSGIIRNVPIAIPFGALVEVYILHTREKASNAGLRLGDDFAQTKVISVAPTETSEEDSIAEE